MNEPVLIERALIADLTAALTAAGTDTDNIFLFGFFTADVQKARYPQIAVTVTPTTAEGTRTTDFSIFRHATVAMTCMTTNAADSDRAVLLTLMDFVTDCRSRMNAQRATWQTAILGRIKVSGITQQDSEPPGFVELPNGEIAQRVAFSWVTEIAVDDEVEE
jgi:hypothetical protein